RASFARPWWGHTRSLAIARDGSGREFVDDGCCSPVISLELRLYRPVGTATDARVDVRVTAVTLYNKKTYWRTATHPFVGQGRPPRRRSGRAAQAEGRSHHRHPDGQHLLRPTGEWLWRVTEPAILFRIDAARAPES